MATAECVAEVLPQFCPVTKHYKCTDGELTWWLLITVPSAEVFGVPVARSHLPQTVDVFLADENAVVLDADMDPSNGMTALAKIPDCRSHEEALELMGYALVG